MPIKCLSGPDAGAVLMLRGDLPVLLGRSAGAGVNDPAVGDQHVVFSVRDGGVRFQAIPGRYLEVNGTFLTEGVLRAGQQFRMGSSVWQVGQPAGYESVLASLTDRLHRLTATDKLEGFSLREMFSEVFKKRTPEEIEEYFIVGTARTTPPIRDVPTGWPKPWFFMRVLLFIGVIYAGFAVAMDQFRNTNLIPGLIMMGSLAMPLSTVFLFFELNAPRNVSFPSVLMLVCLGGIVSLTTSLFGFRVSDLRWLGASSAGIVEEVGKLAAVVLICRQSRFKYILNGMLFGAAVGAGFAVFESAGYAFNYLLEYRSLQVMSTTIHVRAFLSPLGHVAWTAIAGAALWRVKGDQPLSPSMLADARFWKTFLIPVVLHMVWNSPVQLPFYLKYVVLGAIGWFVIFALVQQGLKQVREAQLLQTRSDLKKTQSMIGAAVA
jgi:RsiW-degrading membrane proteinase PrsW (M82 family)